MPYRSPPLAWVLLALCTGCGEAPPQPADTGASPRNERVISLSPRASRFLLALGAEARLVGVDAASSELPGLEHLPVATEATAALHAPDLVILPERQGSPPVDPTTAASVEFAPHELEEVFALTRTLGARLVGVVAAQRFEAALSRPLAAIGGESFGRDRPRVAAIVRTDPLEVAGGHSFETDLIEIAGGRSVTHLDERPRLVADPETLRALAPDLLLVMLPEAPGEEARRAILAALPLDLPVEFFAVDASSFWLEDDPAATARRLRQRIERFAETWELRPAGAPPSRP